MYKTEPMWICRLLTPLPLTPIWANDVIYSTETYLVTCIRPKACPQGWYVDSKLDHDNGDPQLSREAMQQYTQDQVRNLLKDYSDY